MRKTGETKPLFERHPAPLPKGAVVQDLNSDFSYATFPAASVTTLEANGPMFGNNCFASENLDPPYGLEGMMPPPQVSFGKLQPGLVNADDEGVGGAGSFLTATAYGAKG